MRLRTALNRLFPRTSRIRGEAYAREGRVTIESLEPDRARAEVRGTDRYTVAVRLVGPILGAACTCPHASGGELCKHVWATLHVLEKEPLFDRADVDEIAVTSEDGLDELDVLLDEDGDDEFDVDDDEFYDDDDDDEDDRYHVPSRGWAPVRQLAPEQQLLRELEERNRTADALADAFSAREVFYLIDGPATAVMGTLSVSMLYRERLQSGQWSKLRDWKPRSEELNAIASPVDRTLVTLLACLGPLDRFGYGMWDRHLEPAALDLIMPLLGQTGRALLRRSPTDREFLPLVYRPDGGWSLRLAFVRDGEGKLSVDAGIVRGDEYVVLPNREVLLLEGGFGIVRGEILPFTGSGGLPFVPRTARTSRATFALGKARAVAAALMAAPHPPLLELPPELQFRRVEAVPRPRLRVRGSLGGEKGGRAASRLSGELRFVYDDLELPPGLRAPQVPVGTDRIVVRDVGAEQVALDRMQQAGWQVNRRVAPDDAGRFVITVARFPGAASELLASGWNVEAEGRLLHAPTSTSTRVSSGIDWFDLDVDVEFGTERVALPGILAAIRRGEKMIRLGDGTFGLLPEEWLERYGPIAQLAETRGDVLRFARGQALLLDALLLKLERPTTDQVFDRLRAALANASAIEPADPPAGFHGTLRAYQRQGLGWLRFLRGVGLGGCLADDMGLGKTIQVLALLAGNGRSKPSLIVAPRSVVQNWIDEAARFVPSLSVVDHTGAQRSLDVLSAHDLVVTTYGTLRRDAEALSEIPFDTVVLDEAQAIKNPASQASKAVRLLRADQRLVLTGTPIENHLGDLWSLFEFLNPGMLGAASVFKRMARPTLEVSPVQAADLSRALKPFLLRRTKGEVARDLPERTEQTLVCELEGMQRQLYDETREHFRAVLSRKAAKVGIGKLGTEILEALLRLRQLACHPALLDSSRAKESSAKLELLFERLAELREEGHKALVFSQFTSLLALVRERLDADGATYAYLDGSTPAKKRASEVKRFQEEPDCGLFLVSLKAGGFGLNLTAAEYVFLLDPWWNPAVEAQAIDRAHRIGQTRPVIAYRILAKDTIEERVLELQRTKRELAEAILAPAGSVLSGLTKEDLELLLS